MMTRFFFVFFIFFSYGQKNNLNDTIYITSFESKEVVRREKVVIKVKELCLKTSVFDSLINLNMNCVPLFSNKHLITHFEFSVLDNGNFVTVNIRDGIPKKTNDIYGVFFANKMPYLVYLNENENLYFKDTDRVFFIKFYKLYDSENIDISNDIMAIDEVKVVGDKLFFDNRQLNYDWETCREIPPSRSTTH